MSMNKYDFLADICGNCNCLNCECNDSISHNSVEQTSTALHNADNIYDLSTFFDQNLDTNALYLDNTTYLNMHDQPIINNVHDSVLHDDIANTSMCAQNSLNLQLSKKGFKIGHLNIQGVQNKFDEVDLMLTSSDNDIHILGLSETKLRSVHEDNYFYVENYQFFRRDRIISEQRPEQGGGIIVYVKDSVKVERRRELEVDEIECLLLEIFPKKSKRFLVGILYRHPNESINWNENFEMFIDKILETQKEFYLLGDFNRDLLNEQIKKSWLEYLEPFGLIQKVTQATRKSAASETLIDHIYCNTEANINSVDVPQLGLSDHFPVFLTRKTNCSTPKFTHHTISYRSFKNFNEQTFTSDLQDAPWDLIKVFDDTNDVVDTWSHMFLSIVDKHLPLKSHRVKYKQQPRWMSPEIIDAIKTRDRYKSLNNDNQYKIWRNKVASLIKQSKKAQYSALINENNNNPGSVWKLFKEIGIKRKNNTSKIPSLKNGNKCTEDNFEMATQFNNFFVSVASKLKEPVEKCNFEKLKDFCNSKVSDGVQFNIPEVTRDKVLKFLSNIDISKATGCDQIGPRLLKIAAPFIVDSITYICNLSIKNSFFPDKWKVGKVTPLHKSGSKDDVNNFRPISVLPILSKILEKHVHDSLMDFLINHSLLHETQSGFRPSFSCETALLRMINKWLNAINDGLMVGVVMIDFKKAFDLVDHNILLKKLKHYKLSDKTLSWFGSYLLNRKQRVCVNNVISDDEFIINGVPQGSILGPLMFLLFINDLPLYTKPVNTDMYADDTTMYEIGVSQAEIERNLQLALINLSKWCKANGMVINTAKTKLMLITTHQRRTVLNTNNLILSLNNEDLNTIDKDKILGVSVDNNLSWTSHIDLLCKKISSNLWLLSRIKEYLNIEQRTQFYKTYIQPHIDYCNLVWGGTSQINLDRIFRLQKRACKIILDYNIVNIYQSMEDLKILTVFERLFLRKSKFMFKVDRSETPPYINDMFNQRIFDENMPLLRSAISSNFIPPRPKKEIFKQSLIYSGPIVWNSLPATLKNVNSVSSFHNHFIKWLKQ